VPDFSVLEECVDYILRWCKDARAFFAGVLVICVDERGGLVCSGFGELTVSH